MNQVSSLYLHVPFCKHLCNYCDFYKKELSTKPDQFDEFHNFLKKSFLRHQKILHENTFSWSIIDTIYLGGGTPSLWGEEGAYFFEEEILSNLKLSQELEFTMEVDPGAWTLEMLKAWKKIGLNRISVGTQSLNPDFLKVLDRIHTLDDTLSFLMKLKNENWNYSLDFLLGVPYSKEKKRNIRREIDLLLEYKPKHISLYILNARSKYPHIQNMPDDEYIREEYLFVSDYLKSNGYHHYEVSNFALPGFESRHNFKYWRGDSVAALGPTGTGYLALNDMSALRYKWKVSQPEVEVEVLGEEEIKLEHLYLSLRTSDGFDVKNGLERVIENWTQSRYAYLDGDRVKLTSLGFLMLDSLMDDVFRTSL